MVARERGVPTLNYFEALGLASRGMRTIAVSGTHGKTTTAAMLTKILVEAGKSPTAIIGSLSRDFGSNFVAGTSDLFVVEACEYRRHFLSLSPSVLIVTNIDDDHLDYYGSLEGVTDAFGELMQKVGVDGFIVCDPSDPQVKKALSGTSAQVVDYTIISTADLSLQVPGEHNKKNAACALAVADILGVDAEVARKALSEFIGTWRRFEFKGKANGDVLVYDDYAHHPTEIRATLAATREKFPNANLTVVFHPHLFSRTKLLLEQFAGAFEGADKVVFAPIYAAREAFDPSVSSNLLAAKVAKRGIETLSLTGFDEIVHYLKGNTPAGGIVMTMGAGDIFKVGEALVAQ